MAPAVVIATPQPSRAEGGVSDFLMTSSPPPSSPRKRGSITTGLNYCDALAHPALSIDHAVWVPAQGRDDEVRFCSDRCAKSLTPPPHFPCVRARRPEARACRDVRARR